MTENTNERKPTVSMDKAGAYNAIYWLAILGLVMYVCFADVWPYTQILAWNLDDQNQYYPKLVFMETLLVIGAPAWVLHWIIKKIMGDKKKVE